MDASVSDMINNATQFFFAWLSIHLAKTSASLK